MSCVTFTPDFSRFGCDLQYLRCDTIQTVTGTKHGVISVTKEWNSVFNFEHIGANIKLKARTQSFSWMSHSQKCN